MIDLTLSERAHNSQGGCTTCGRQDGPFALVPAFRDEVGQPVYYCERCAGCIVAAFHWPTRDDLARAEAERDEAHARVRMLEAEKEQILHDRATATAKLAGEIGAQVIDFLAERQKRRPETIGA